MIISFFENAGTSLFSCDVMQFHYPNYPHLLSFICFVYAFPQSTRNGLKRLCRAQPWRRLAGDAVIGSFLIYCIFISCQWNARYIVSYVQNKHDCVELARIYKPYKRKSALTLSVGELTHARLPDSNKRK